MNLIKQNSKQRYYQLDFRIVNHFGPGGKTIADIWKGDPMRLNPEYELVEDIANSIDKVCISDAHTHIERLVFPAFNVRNKKTGEITTVHRNNQIDGSLTFMTHGGDSKSVRDDAVYIRHLRMANKKEEEMPCET